MIKDKASDLKEKLVKIGWGFDKQVGNDICFYWGDKSMFINLESKEVFCGSRDFDNWGYETFDAEGIGFETIVVIGEWIKKWKSL